VVDGAGMANRRFAVAANDGRRRAGRRAGRRTPESLDSRRSRSSTEVLADRNGIDRWGGSGGEESPESDTNCRVPRPRRSPAT